MNHKVMIISIAAALSLITGCGGKAVEQELSTLESQAAQKEEVTNLRVRTELAEICRGIYGKSLEDGTFGTLAMVREMSDALGEQGYAVADQDNQIDMKNQELMEAFCEKVERKQTGEQRLIMVLNNGGFIQFDFQTAGGKVNVGAFLLKWREKELVPFDTDHFQAYTWIYTEYGYLFFEKEYMPGLSGPHHYTAVRIKPLDETCRELNRSYVLPIGYGADNLLFSDWSENEWGDVNFYDLFEILKPADFLLDGKESKDDGTEVFQISKEQFEEVIMAYVPVNSQTLKETCIFREDTGTYEYSPRGPENSGTGTEAPFPEVIAYEKRGDGTVSLTVNAVWPERGLESAFMHELVIRPLEDGRFRYVSNRVIPSKKRGKPDWYLEREDVSASERAESDTDCLAVMADLKELYLKAERGTSLNPVPRRAEETTR